MNNLEQQSAQPVLEAQDLHKSFVQGKAQIKVLKGLNLSVAPGERVAILGASGSGKSTLLQLLGGLDQPTSGEVEVQGRSFSGLKDKERGLIRNRWLGFVYQFHHLLPEFTALENVAMPLLIAKQELGEVRNVAATILEKVGLGHRLDHKPAQLSGGERQRAALARALVANPGCVLADEPTGNLDEKTAAKVFDLLLKLNTDLGTSLVIVTHDQRLANRLDTKYELGGGVLNRQ